MTMLALVVTFPVLCLVFLLWMAWLEDSLPDAVRKAERRPDPPPVLAVAVTPRAPVPVTAEVWDTTGAGEAPVVQVRVPAQRGETILGAEPHGDAEPAVAPGLA
ncbi:MAG TPA: hypothetical protein VH915_04250 [Pedococcus sp.]